MNVLVLNGAPAGKNSITLQTVGFIEKHFPMDTFEVLHVGQRIHALEKDFDSCVPLLEKADLILFCYPVYTFLVPSQLHRFIEMMKEHGGLEGKYATQLSTSLHFYDITAHRFIQDICADMGLRYIRGLSADMEDLLKERGQKEALDFYRFVRWSMQTGCAGIPEEEERAPFTGVTAKDAEEEAEKKEGTVAIVADLSDDADGRLSAMIHRFTQKTDRQVRVADIGQFPFAGGCLGCFRCAADGTCVYKDGFDRYLREQIQSADAIVYAYSIKDHSMGYRFKLFDDRQFCNGHRTVTMGKPVGYLVDGALSREENLRTLMEARAQVGGNFLAGTACDEKDPDGEIDRLAQTLGYALDEDYQPPKNFYGVGGMKVFRDLIWQMQGLMREDHRFYKKHGFYDFPQKRRGRMMAMYLVGGMMRSKKLRGKIGGKMTEGMLLPYRKAMEKAEKRGEK
ncbi:MAG: NAD(P)H-dependent oxidoreductase [Clostridia bacterium]|nr:NAD(P)H-dependent oxidoreductase [Clostridia bacterium]